MVIEGNVIDVVAGRVFPGRVRVEGGRIASIVETPGVVYETWIGPGLVDAHVHVESSLLGPVEFGRAALVHGTTASVSDPHEIANVLGVPGVEWMLEQGRRTPFQIAFGAPSCVPATPFETAGARFGPEEVDALLSKPEVLYLAEVMNFPAVIGRDPAMMAIVEVAKRRGKRIDGHAPGVMGEAAERYVSAGIETDHECVSLEEALAKCRLGMKIAIREGSAARNFDALWPVLNAFPEQCFLCSDDKHPDDLVVSHINALVARAVANGIDPMVAMRAATLNPVRHYGLGCGLLQPGDRADMVEWDGFEQMNCLRCWVAGELVAAEGKSQLPFEKPDSVNLFKAQPKHPEDFVLPKQEGNRRIIVALDGQLLTDEVSLEANEADPGRDLLYIAVVNRYSDEPPAVALIQGFGLRDGAMASSVAHDSHNVVAVGTNFKDISRAVNLVITAGGGLSIVAGSGGQVLPLPIAGLMSDGECGKVASSFTGLTRAAKQLGCELRSPFMTLSFMALLVIPSLKLSDKGLFDVNTFSLLDK